MERKLQKKGHCYINRNFTGWESGACNDKSLRDYIKQVFKIFGRCDVKASHKDIVVQKVTTENVNRKNIRNC